ncbi:ATP-binding protein [Paenibacillus sedimenti]|uniref:AAA family ATPase n=1 Tax=Paenibacillus sedimenti TaxID=2770274 RepID=A0A926KP09_9BACL|nr:AAA family ATPase [Paenibacillus sedimenti]MBD0379520.1 AAA family ATPase [Paenibacillus sedimenti]
MLGTFNCIYAERPLAKLPTGKLQLLFAYLLLHADIPVNRKHLAFLFWPDSSEAQAMTNLRKLLYDLKKLLPASDLHLELRDGQVVWHSRDLCTVDVIAFEKQQADSAPIAELAKAIALYQGELLPGVYDEWVVNRRESLAGHYASLLDRMIGLFEQRREFDAAITYATRLVQLDRFSEAAHLKLIRLSALSGDLAASQKRAEDMAALFEAELGVSPSEETKRIIRRLLDAANTARQQPVYNNPKPPLIGRRLEWEQLLHAWGKAVQEHSLLVELEGEAGIGKTRLTEEFAFWAQSQGIRVLTSRCFASGGSSAYEPVTTWLQKVTFDHLDSSVLIELSRMLPEIKDRYPELPSPGPLHEAWQLRSWYHANQQALYQDQPTILILDDLQWSDKETLQMIEYFLRTDHPHPLLVVCTIRTEAGTGDVYFTEFLQSLRTRRQSLHIAMAPLTEAETGQLILSFAAEGNHSFPVKQIHEVSGGNPLFIHEIVRRGNEAMQDGYGSSILTMMVQRLADLPSLCQKVIGIMTVIGKPISLPFILELADQGEKALSQVELLQQLRIMKRTEDGGLDFYHERMREAARIRMSESKKQLLHGLVAKAMENSGNMRLFSNAEIAFHYESAACPAEAAVYYEKAALEARQVFAHEMTIRYSLKLLPTADQKKKLELLSWLAEAYRISGNWAGAEKTYRTWLQSCELDVPLEQKALHQAALGNCLRLLGRYAESLQELQQASQLFDMLEHREGLAEVYGYLGIVYQYMGKYGEAEIYLRKRMDLSPEGEEDGKFTGILGNVYWEQEQYAEAANCYKKQIRIANGKGDRHSLGQAFGGMTLTNLELEQMDWAFHAVGEKLSISRSLGDRMGVANSIGLMGKVYLRSGYYEEARICLLYCLQEALQIGDVRVIALVLSLLGHTWDEQGEDQAAWLALEQSERLAGSLGIPYIHCDTLYFMGLYSVKRARWDKAQNYVRQAMPLAEQQRRFRLCGMLETLVLRIGAGIGEVSRAEVTERLQMHLDRISGTREQFMIHLASWELCRSEESRVQASAMLEDLYQKATVPFYKKWEQVLSVELTGPLRSAPSIPREALASHIRFEDIAEAVRNIG